MMGSHWTQQVATCLATDRPARVLSKHLDALLLWLANPESPRAQGLGHAIARRKLGREQAAASAYRLLDEILFSPDGNASSETLGLRPEADPALAKQRYRRLVQVYHPDRHPTRAAWATERMDQLNRAFAAFRKGGLPDPSGRHGKGRRSHQAARRPKGALAQRFEPLLLRLERRWPKAAALISRMLERLSGANRLVLAGAAAGLGLVLILSALDLGEKPKRPPRIIHHPLPQIVATPTMPGTTQTPGETRALSRGDQTTPAAEPPPQIESRGEQVPKIEAPTPSRPTQKPGIEHVPEETPAPPATTPQAPAPAAPTPPPAPAAAEPSAPPEPLIPTTDEEPVSERPVLISPAPQPAPQSTQPPTGAARTQPAPETATPTPPPLETPTSEPRISIPPAAPPQPPTAPAAPEVPLQISSAAVATPEAPLVASSSDLCAKVPEILKRFQSSYQRGALRAFMALYSPLAQENQLATWLAIRQTYADWFAKTSARRIDFEQLRVEPTAEGNRCAAMALFQVSYRDAQSLLVTKAGVIQILFEPEGSEMRILRIRY